MDQTVIDVYADIVCPFTHVGLRRWVERRAELGRDDVHLRVRAWPLEIINDEPMDPEAVAHKAADLRDQVAPGLFGGFDPAHFPATSLPALALTNVAYRRCGVEAGEAMALRLRQLLFEEGVDISDPDVLANEARAAGVPWPLEQADEEAVLDDLAQGRERGVIGSPHFFTPDGTGLFCPSLEIAKQGDRFDIHLDFQAFTQLTDACFQ